MDFVSDNFLNSKNVNEINIQIYFKIYQQLGFVRGYLVLVNKKILLNK